MDFTARFGYTRRTSIPRARTGYALTCSYPYLPVVLTQPHRSACCWNSAFAVLQLTYTCGLPNTPRFCSTLLHKLTYPCRATAATPRSYLDVTARDYLRTDLLPAVGTARLTDLYLGYLLYTTHTYTPPAPNTTLHLRSYDSYPVYRALPACTGAGHLTTVNSATLPARTHAQQLLPAAFTHCPLHGLCVAAYALPLTRHGPVVPIYRIAPDYRATWLCV